MRPNHAHIKGHVTHKSVTFLHVDYHDKRPRKKNSHNMIKRDDEDIWELDLYWACLHKLFAVLKISETCA